MSFSAGFNPAVTWQTAQLIVVAAGRLLYTQANGFWRWEQIQPLGLRVNCAHHLGYWHGAPLCVVELLASPDYPVTYFVSLRSLLDQVPAEEFDLFGRSLQIVQWHKSHRFCGHCGANTQLSDSELCLICNACQARYYPRISPCVIGLVSRGRELLLAHHLRHQEPRYSLLAGFIEPGESAEQALAREIFEEVGIEVAQIRYVTSQPWPFPGQLMLGFFAEYAAGDLSLDAREIRDARWFAPDALPLIPPPQTIAGKLILQRVAELQSLPSNESLRGD